jgi:MFS transporter, FSR family, fosmidomycin resistance protein
MNRRRLATLTASHLIDDLYQGAVPALVALMVLARGYSYAAATGLTLAATVLSSVAQPAFGLLTDRRPMRWLLPSGLALAGIGIGLSGMSDDYALTWAAIALSGLGVAAYHPEASRAARGAAGGTAVGMSWFALGGNIGFAAGPPPPPPCCSSQASAAPRCWPCPPSPRPRCSRSADLRRGPVHRRPRNASARRAGGRSSG